MFLCNLFLWSQLLCSFVSYQVSNSRQSYSQAFVFDASAVNNIVGQIHPTLWQLKQMEPCRSRCHIPTSGAR